MSASDTLASIFDAAAGPSPQYHMNSGSSGQLPYGEASQLNQDSQGLPTSTAPPGGAQAAPAGAGPTPSQAPPQGAAAPDIPFKPQNAIDQFLASPATTPGNPMTPVETQLPDGWQSWVVAANGAAQLPDAPAWLQAFALRASEASAVAEQQQLGG